VPGKTAQKPCLPEVSGPVVPVVFATNDNYAPYAGVAIQSILCHADPAKEYRIYILHTGISPAHIAALEDLSTENAAVRCLNITDIMHTVQTPLPVVYTLSVEAYYRLLIPELPELREYPFVIYLDCDVVVCGDIADILPHDMGDKLLAGVVDHPMKREQDRKRLAEDYQLDAAQYINSGVLVFNVPQWRQENTARQCFDFLAGIPSGKFVYMDQDIINAVCRGRIFYLDDAWNFIWYIRYGDEETIAVCKPASDRVGDNFRIIHYTTSWKPWCTLGHPMGRYFWRYAGLSPFMEEIIKTNLVSKAEMKQESHPVSLRIGLAVTWLPRKIRGGIQCFRDHGAGYTLRRCLYHLGLWEDEE
jgi:lipopolysaccharide biosynthesis glycosyltransferase